MNKFHELVIFHVKKIPYHEMTIFSLLQRSNVFIKYEKILMKIKYSIVDEIVLVLLRNLTIH